MLENEPMSRHVCRSRGYGSERFSGDSAKAEMGEDWCKKHQKPSSRTEFVVTALAPVIG